MSVAKGMDIKMIKISKFKIIASLILVILLSIILLILNGIYGNPISKSIAEQAADEYMANNYNDTDFFIEEIVYNFNLNSTSFYENH